jgi:hypothetical protein
VTYIERRDGTEGEAIRPLQSYIHPEIEKQLKTYPEKTLWSLRVHGSCSTSRSEVYLKIGVNRHVPELYIFGRPGHITTSVKDQITEETKNMFTVTDGNFASDAKKVEPASHVLIGVNNKFIERILTIPQEGNTNTLTSLKHNEIKNPDGKLEVVTDVASMLQLEPGSYTLTEIIDHLGSLNKNIPDKLFVSSCADGRPIPMLSNYQHTRLVERFFVPDRNANEKYNEEAVIQTFVRDTVFKVGNSAYRIGGKYPTVNMHPAFADEELYPAETQSIGKISDFAKKRLLVWLKMTSMQIQSNQQDNQYYDSAKILISTCVSKMNAAEVYNSLFDKMAFNKDTISNILFMFNYLSFQNDLLGFKSELQMETFKYLCVFYGLGTSTPIIGTPVVVTDEIFQAAIDFMTDSTKEIGGSSSSGGGAATVAGAAAGFAVTVAASVAGAFLV